MSVPLSEDHPTEKHVEVVETILVDEDDDFDEDDDDDEARRRAARARGG